MGVYLQSKYVYVKFHKKFKAFFENKFKFYMILILKGYFHKKRTFRIFTKSGKIKLSYFHLLKLPNSIISNNLINYQSMQNLLDGSSCPVMVFDMLSILILR